MEPVSYLASFIGGIAVPALYALFRFLLDWRTTRTKLKMAEEKAFTAALGSESLGTLGTYLDRSLGQFLLSEYAHNTAIRERVNLFVARLQEYVGSQDEVPSSEDLRLPKKRRPRTRVTDYGLKLVEDKLVSGPAWDALAALRHLIETRLRSFAEQREVSLPKRVGAGGILQALQRAQQVSTDVTAALRYAIDVANRGVHGFEVPVDEISEALRQARFGLSKLGLLESPEA